jgi:hypothetical protein
MPTLPEGFDALHFVRIGADSDFLIEEWRDAV